MLIRPCQYIHTALLIYPYGPGKIFIRPCHTDQLDYLKVLRTGCFCIGPGIDSRSAVLDLGPTGLGANTANLESIPGPIQKQPVSNTILIIWIYHHICRMVVMAIVGKRDQNLGHTFLKIILCFLKRGEVEGTGIFSGLVWYYSIITWCFSYWPSYRSKACCIGLRRSRTPIQQIEDL